MRGSTQWTRGGQDRENALLQGYLAQGVPFDQASQLAAQQAGPADVDMAFGRVIIWFFKASILFAIFVGALGFWLEHKQHVYDKCLFSHTLVEVNDGVCGKDPSDQYRGENR